MLVIYNHTISLRVPAIALALLGWAVKGIAQSSNKSEFGLLTEYAFRIPTLVDGQIGDKFVLLEREEKLDGFRVGMFARFFNKKTLINLEAGYFEGYSSFLHYDLQPEPDTLFPGFNFPGLSSFKHRMFKLSAGYGFFLLRNLSLDAGITGAYQMKALYPCELDTVPGRPPLDERANCLLNDAFAPIVLSGYVRSSYYFGPLTIYFMLEQNFNSIFGNVLYKDNEYSVNVRLQSWSLGVSYSLFSKPKG